MGSIFNKPAPVIYKHRNQVEQGIHRRVCTYIRREYPGVMFRTDGGGLKLSKTQAVAFNQMQSDRGWPDLHIPVAKRGYHGLYIELKQEGTTIYLKIGPNKGQLVADPHIRQQAAVLSKLNKEGYFARFGVGYDAAIKLINWYMEKPENTSMF